MVSTIIPNYSGTNVLCSEHNIIFGGLIQFVWEFDIAHNVWLCLNQMRVHLARNHVIPSASRNDMMVEHEATFSRERLQRQFSCRYSNRLLLLNTVTGMPFYDALDQSKHERQATHTLWWRSFFLK
jgi:hypothetical protein